MRVMTFNVQHCLDYKNQRIDTDLFADTVKRLGADLCGFNEIRGKGEISEYTDQTNALGERIGYERYFGEAIRFAGVNPYGNAFVSRYPIKSAETFIIPDTADRSEPTYYETRCVIKAVIDADGTDVCVFVCHMGLAKSEARCAVEVLCRLIDETELPCIAMGDFNHTKDSGILDPLFQRLSDSDDMAKECGVYTYSSYAPEKKIDYILYRGLKCTRAEVVTEMYSDHFPIIADFEV